MKKLVRKPLKMTAAAAFMVALGYGISTNSKISELSSFLLIFQLLQAAFFITKKDLNCYFRYWLSCFFTTQTQIANDVF